MKVVFKLSMEQIARAKLATSFVAQYEHPGMSKTGNLLFCCDDSPCWNPNQHMDLQGSKITYIGNRHPLVVDGGMDVLAFIAGYSNDLAAELSSHESLRKACEDSFSKLEVVFYETSDSRLRWYETLDSYMDARGTLMEVISFGERYGCQWLLAVLAGRFPEMLRAVTLLEHNPRRAYAEFDSEVIKLGRRICLLQD